MKHRKILSNWGRTDRCHDATDRNPETSRPSSLGAWIMPGRASCRFIFNGSPQTLPQSALDAAQAWLKKDIKLPAAKALICLPKLPGKPKLS